MKISYNRTYQVFESIYVNRHNKKQLDGKELKIINKLGLPASDKSFIKNINDLRSSLENATNLKEFNLLKSADNKAEQLKGQKDNELLEFKVRVDQKHRKHFMCIDCNNNNTHIIKKNWHGDFESVDSITIKEIHSHKYKK